MTTDDLVIMALSVYFFSRRKGVLALHLFLLALALRLALNLIFFLRHGWFASNLIEIWYYYGVAQGIYHLSWLDPTFLLLRLLGWLLPSSILYQAVALVASLISALTAVLIFFWWSSRQDDSVSSGWWAGWAYSLLPAPLTLGLANFSHDLVQIPVLILFFWALEASIREQGMIRRTGAIAITIALLFSGLSVGPVMGAAVIVGLLYGFWLLLSRLVRNPANPWPTGFYLLVLATLNFWLYGVMGRHLLEWMIPLAWKLRGIDLAAQLRILVGDLQPLPDNGLWNRYNFFLFFVPWGLWTAVRKRELLSVTMFFFSLTLALVVNRGARLLDLALVLVVGSAFSTGGKRALQITLVSIAAFLGLNTVAPRLASSLWLSISQNLFRLWMEVWAAARERGLAPDILIRFELAGLLIGFLLLGAAWAIAFQAGKKWLTAVLITATVLLQAGWVMLSVSASSEQIEYAAYRWLNAHSRPGEKIFAAWNQGYFLKTVSHLEPITTPDRIDFDLTRIYWQDERQAAKKLEARGVKYVHVCSRYFGVTGVDPVHDTFTMCGNTIIGPRPVHITRFSRLRQTFLYLLNYEPGNLKYFRPIYDNFDPGSGVGVRIFELE